MLAEPLPREDLLAHEVLPSSEIRQSRQRAARSSTETQEGGEMLRSDGHSGGQHPSLDAQNQFQRGRTAFSGSSPRTATVCSASPVTWLAQSVDISGSICSHGSRGE